MRTSSSANAPGTLQAAAPAARLPRNRRRLGRHQHRGVADRLHQPHRRLHRLGDSALEAADHVAHVLGRHVLAELGEADDVDEADRDRLRAREPPALELGLRDHDVPHLLAQAQVEHLLEGGCRERAEVVQRLGVAQRQIDGGGESSGVVSGQADEGSEADPDAGTGAGEGDDDHGDDAGPKLDVAAPGGGEGGDACDGGPGGTLEVSYIWIVNTNDDPPTVVKIDTRTMAEEGRYLTRADGHGSVANSAAIRIAKVDRNTASPFGGEIMKDKSTGEPNGMFLDRAQGLIGAHVPRETRADLEQAIYLGAKRSVELGWCQIQNAGNSYDEIELIKKLYGEGRIKLRIYNAVRGPSSDTERLLREGPILGAYDNRFTVRTIKVAIDGALGSKGAALLENYNDHDTNGFLTWKEEQVLPMLVSALKQGIQVETHAIGDRANRTILDWYEKAFNLVPSAERKIRDPRWRVEHAQILNPTDIPRFHRLGVIPSMQPSHAIGDLHFAPSRIGIARLAGAYAWQSLIKSGCIIAGGSDAPVERGEPMIEFYAAVARKDQKGFLGEGWHPEEKVTREQALKMFTLWAAYAAFEENLKGSIEVGKLADLTVLSADIMRIPEADILKTRCVMTVIGGEVAFSASN